MSAETPADSRLEKRRRRAEQDVRLAHGALLQLLNRHRGEGWAAPLADGWSPAEILFHVLLVLEEALAELRLAAAAGLPTHPPVPAPGAPRPGRGALFGFFGKTRRPISPNSAMPIPAWGP